MKPSRFCLTVAGSAILVAILVVTFNVVVDPYLLFDRPRVAGLNAIKPAAGTREFMMKAYDASRTTARTIILGSSRTDIGLDPSHSAWPESSRPVYNLSLAGGSIGTGLLYLQNMMAEEPVRTAPQTIIVGLDFESFLYRPAATGKNAVAQAKPTIGETEERLRILPNGSVNGARTLRMWKDYATSVLSLDALADSIATLSANRLGGAVNMERNGHISEALLRQTVAADGVAALFAQKNRDTYRQYAAPRRVLSDVPGGPIRGLGDVQRLIDFCKAHQMALILAIQPAHVSRLNLLSKMGYWDDYERWKRALVETALTAGRSGAKVTVWDFGGYDAYSSEPIPRDGDRAARMQWFWDPVHHTTALGDLMVTRMMHPELPGSYGVELTPASIEKRLAAVRQASK